jgi:hypothetical protein
MHRTSTIPVGFACCEARHERMFLAEPCSSNLCLTAGRYLPGVKPPFDCGFESIGYVAAKGNDCDGISVGDAVAIASYGAFSEYQVVPSKALLPVSRVDIWPSLSFILSLAVLTIYIANTCPSSLGPNGSAPCASSARFRSHGFYRSRASRSNDHR